MLCRLSYFWTLLNTIPVIMKLFEKDKVMVSPSFAENALLNCISDAAMALGNFEKILCFFSWEKLSVAIRQSSSMPNDLLIEKSGGSENQPVGRIAIIEHQHTENQFIAYSNFIHKIRVDESIVNPVYLFHFLKTIHNIKITESMQSQTNGIRNLIMSEYFNQTIILPEIQTQIDIAQKITSLKNQAQPLQTEAKQILEQAKAEVERMILGE